MGMGWKHHAVVGADNEPKRWGWPGATRGDQQEMGAKKPQTGIQLTAKWEFNQQEMGIQPANGEPTTPDSPDTYFDRRIK